MANEFERINNPDSLPGAVATGYQLQNTNLVAQRVGIDMSVVIGGTGECTLEISGPVDVNGEIYTCNAAVTFTLTVAGKYYIHLAGSGANLTPTIGTGANTFDADKNARYTDTGTYRVLNWMIGYDGTTARVSRLFNPELGYNNVDDSVPPELYIKTNSTWTSPQSKYYKFIIGTQIKRLFINAGRVWTFTTNLTSICSFTDGTLTVTNSSGGDYTYPISSDISLIIIG